jgi:hypothetical protein
MGLTALRQRELYSGLTMEQEKLPTDAKGKGRKPCKGELKSTEAVE